MTFGRPASSNLEQPRAVEFRNPQSMVKPEEVRPRDMVLNSQISTSVHSSRCKTSLMQQSQSSQKLNKTTASFCTEFAPREHKPSPYHHTTRVITDQKYNQMLQTIEQR